MNEVLWLSVAGFLFSFYGLVEVSRMNKDPYYKPLCDINRWISCSKAFLSKFGTTFGMPNPLGGVIYYVALIILSLNSSWVVLAYVSTAALIFTAYLAYLLYFKIRTLCIVCTLIYLINVLIFILVVV